MSENNNQAETSTPSSESHKHTPPKLKKQITYAGGLAERKEGNENGGDFPSASSLNRTNSFSIKEEHTSDNSESNLTNHANGQDADNQCFLLHRTDEVENLADQDLLFSDDLGKSNLELFASKAHLKRTRELENLNEINNE
jgi:hypothetical protein